MSNTCFCNITYKNCNTRAVVLVKDILAARTFLLNTSLAIFTLAFIKIVT